MTHWHSKGGNSPQKTPTQIKTICTNNLCTLLLVVFRLFTGERTDNVYKLFRTCLRQLCFYLGRCFFLGGGGEFPLMMTCWPWPDIMLVWAGTRESQELLQASPSHGECKWNLAASLMHCHITVGAEGCSALHLPNLVSAEPQKGIRENLRSILCECEGWEPNITVDFDTIT